MIWIILPDPDLKLLFRIRSRIWNIFLSFFLVYPKRGNKIKITLNLFIVNNSDFLFYNFWQYRYQHLKSMFWIRLWILFPYPAKWFRFFGSGSAILIVTIGVCYLMLKLFALTTIFLTLYLYFRIRLRKKKFWSGSGKMIRILWIQIRRIQIRHTDWIYVLKSFLNFICKTVNYLSEKCSSSSTRRLRSHCSAAWSLWWTRRFTRAEDASPSSNICLRSLESTASCTRQVNLMNLHISGPPSS